MAAIFDNASAEPITDRINIDHEKIRDALIDLYLSVKIRTNEEIDDYNRDMLADERNKLRAK